MLRTYRKYNPTVELSKYEFNNKLLGGVLYKFQGNKKLITMSSINGLDSSFSSFK